MLYRENLDALIFNRHETHQSDELVILSGYLGPSPISKLKELPFNATVIYGMYGEAGISEHLHNSLVKLQDENSKLNILYSTSPVHSKCYAWKNNGRISHALIGSANFSTNGLTTPNREVLAETTVDSFDPLNKYIEYVINNSIQCNKLDLNEFSKQEEAHVEPPQMSNKFCRMSLLGKNGEVQPKSGLNWGHGGAKNKIDDAYIKIKASFLKDYPEMFPPKKLGGGEGGKVTRHNDKIEIIWDDGVVMEGLLEGNASLKGDAKKYPSQISSSPSKEIIGKYIRRRIGVAEGDFVTKDDLINYGKSYIDVSLISEGVYQFDFSVGT